MASAAEMLRAWRLEKGLSQKKAASLLDLPEPKRPGQVSWSCWERGEKPPCLASAVAIQKLTRGRIKAAHWVAT